jgi:VWFA-related protein
MKRLIFALPVLLAATLPLAGQQIAQDSPIELDTEPLFRIGTLNIVAPVLVTDRDGNIVDGLQPSQFHLWDNGKEQNIQVDVTYEPISLVVAIQCSARVETLLPQIKHLGSILQNIIGVQGEAAVLKFDGRLQVTQDFTNDPDKIKAAINKIQPGSSGSRMIDAVDRGVRMLSKRPKNNRKIVLLVSETRDEGSETRLKQALINANLTNTLVYTVDITQLMVRLTEKRPDPRPTRVDPTTMNAPLGIPNTPTTADTMYSMGNRAQFVPLLKEIYTDAKGIFVRDPATQFARSTGGHEFYFMSQRGLEDAVQKIGTEIHSHYMISYKPNNQTEGGYHTIEVTLDDPKLATRTRPGYWLGGGTQ